MQRGARFVIRKVPFAVPCWVKSGRQKRYKTNAFCTFSKSRGAGSGHTKNNIFTFFAEK